MSNASDDLPDPETPVRTTSFRLGMATSTFLRLCSLAPLMRMWSSSSAAGFISSGIVKVGGMVSMITHAVTNRLLFSRDVIYVACVELKVDRPSISIS